MTNATNTIKVGKAAFLCSSATIVPAFGKYYPEISTLDMPSNSTLNSRHDWRNSAS